MSCTHKTHADFSVTTHIGRRLWCCSNCGRQQSWGKGWSYFGNLECRRCQVASIEAVACSSACAEELMRAGVGE